MKQSSAAVLLIALILGGGACRRAAQTPSPADVENKVAVRPVSLFFESGTMTLASESRSVPLPENPAAAVPMVVRELMKGPEQESLLRLWPEDTVVRGAYLLPGGTVVVDLGGETLTGGWNAGSHHEWMTIHSLAHTLSANFSDAARVRLLINGTPAETLAGHISLSRSHAPAAGLLTASR